MSFTSFLKKFGEDVLRVAPLLEAFAPAVIAALPASGAVAIAVSDLTKIAGTVQTAEAMFAANAPAGAKTGPQKLAAATPVVAQIIQGWLGTGQVGAGGIADQTKFTAAVSGITSGFADLLNALKPKG